MWMNFSQRPLRSAFSRVGSATPPRESLLRLAVLPRSHSMCHGWPPSHREEQGDRTGLPMQNREAAYKARSCLTGSPT